MGWPAATISRWLALAGLLLALPLGCRTLGQGPTWEALLQAGRLSDQVLAEDGLPLAFEAVLQGPGEPADGPLLLLVHGFCADRRSWGPLDGEPWSGRNLLSLDLAGHGASSGERGLVSIEALARDVVRLVDHLGLLDVVVVGHGLGAQVALEAAALRPQVLRGVVAVEAFHDLDQQFTVEQATLMERAFAADFAGTLALYVDGLMGAEPPPGLAERVLEELSETPLETALAMLAASFAHDVRQALVTLPVPLVLVNGEQRPTDRRALAGLVPGAAVVLVPGAGYFLPREQPVAFGRALDQALSLIDALWETRS